MNYIADSILILADCSNFDGRSREDLFMNSRDRLSDVPLKSEIEKSLEKIVKEHPGLRELKTKRRQEDIGKKYQMLNLWQIYLKMLLKNLQLCQIF